MPLIYQNNITQQFSRKHKIKVDNFSAKTESVKKYLPLNEHEAGNYGEQKANILLPYTALSWLLIDFLQEVSLKFRSYALELQTHFHFIYVCYIHIYIILRLVAKGINAHFNSIHTMHTPPHPVQQEAYAGLTDKG